VFHIGGVVEAAESEQPVDACGTGRQAELVLERGDDPPPGPAFDVIDDDVEQLATERPQIRPRFVVRVGEWIVERLVLRLQRERIVTVEVRIDAEQEQHVADRELRQRQLPEHLGEAQRARRPGVPGIARRARVEPGQHRQRVEVLGEDLRPLGSPSAPGQPLGVVFE
jgi:hypothetical protein